MPLRKLTAAMILTLAATLALGQASAPATRPSTAGTIAKTAADAVPLGKSEKVPKVTLKTVEGKAFDLNAEIAKKPTLLIFYRGGWCPYCNTQLSSLQGITQELSDAGYQLLAISPDKPDEEAKTLAKHDLKYTLLSDADAAAIKAFGLAFTAPANYFSMLETSSGEKHHALPVPAVYILDTTGTIQFVQYDPDYTKRMDPTKIVEEARKALKK